MVQVFHPQDVRPTLCDIWTSYNFDKSAVAIFADVDASTVNDMMASMPVPREDAEKVLSYLSKQYDKDFSLDTVYVVLKRPKVNKSAVARILQEIDAEYQSALLGMQGLAQGTLQHEFITKKMEEMARQIIALGKREGEDTVMQAMIHWQDNEQETSA